MGARVAYLDVVVAHGGSCGTGGGYDGGGSASQAREPPHGHPPGHPPSQAPGRDLPMNPSTRELRDALQRTLEQARAYVAAWFVRELTRMYVL